MKAQALFISCILFAASLSAFAGEPTKFAYEQKNAVWVGLIEGKGANKISRGQSPDLSPDGKKLAFNTVQEDGQPAHRQIAVADLESGNVTVFKDIPFDNCMEAVWSPDGSKILFTYYVNNSERHLATVNADGTGFAPLEKDKSTRKDYWSATWAADGKSLYAQDMENLYQLDLDAKVLKKWVVEKLVPHGSMSGDVRLQASKDGKTLLMDVEMDEKERKGWDGPPPAVWTLDLATEKVTRLTPKTLYAWESRWFGPDAIIFVSEEPGSETTCIYRMSLTGGGKDKKLLLKDATIPSAAQ